MTVLTRWSPIGNLASIEIDRLNRMFNSAFSGEPLSRVWAPAVDIYENAQQDVVLKAEVPGLKRDAIKVTFEHTTLTLEGAREVDAAVPQEKFHRLERQDGTFRRSFTLPATVDSATAQATYQDGVLTLTLPRREETKPRTIQVNG